MKKEVYMPVLGIITGEVMIFFGYMYLSLAIHVINLQAITLALIFSDFPPEIKNVLQSLILLLLLRIVSLSMPHLSTTIIWYPLVYGVMFLPIYFIIKNQRISLKEIGIDLKHLRIYLPAAVLIGVVMALIEYGILHPKSLIEDVRPSNLILITVIMFVFVGTVEELIFRSILLTRLEKILGLKHGLLLSGVISGIMYSGYGIMNEILFAIFFGIIIGYIFQKTRSFPFILTIHGTADIFLLGLLPVIFSMI